MKSDRMYQKDCLSTPWIKLSSAQKDEAKSIK